MSRSTGFNVHRQVVGGVGANDITQERRQSYFGGTPPMLQRAVVVDVIYDVSRYNDPSDVSGLAAALEDSVANPEVVGIMPQNSVVARIISNEHDLGDPVPFIFFPLFSSHFEQPIKPGEQVFVMYEDYTGRGNAIGYWVTRAPAIRAAEDLNYTHGDRIFQPENNLRNLTTTQKSNLTATTASFPNGAGTQETYSLLPSGSTNPYDDILGAASASLITQFEVVPRQKKRPGDFALFGSNNSAIILGRDRTGPVMPITGTNAADVLSGSGTIDLVAGLGARRIADNPDGDPGGSNHNPTAARAVQNSRGALEVDKVPYMKQKVDNPNEGDPDFKRDLSRVYISMKTKGDKNFGINFGGDGGIFTGTADKFGTALTDQDASTEAAGTDAGGQPFIVAKSEHIRIIGTGLDSDNGPATSGDIRIIKEATAGKQPTDDPKDFAMVTLEADGRIMVQGNKVYIQFNDPDDGRILLGCKDDTTDNADPLVLYTKLKDELVAEIVSKLEALRDKVADQFGNIANQGITAPNAAGPFSPIPALIATKVQCTLAKTNIKAVTFSSITDKVPKLKSKNAFMKKDNQG